MIPSSSNGFRAANDPALALKWRKRLMQICSRAKEDEFETALTALGLSPQVEDVRAPQTGLIMLRGRIGAGGSAFNVGEATMTRAVVRLPCGRTGFGYLLGRSHKRARLAAIFDALGQDERYIQVLEQHFIEPVDSRWRAEKLATLEHTAATKVDFFTLVRGED